MVELADLGLTELSDSDRNAILAGQENFATVGCNSCHVQQMALDEPIFSEPSRTPGYYDMVFPDGSLPIEHGLRQDTALSFDMRIDPPNNQVLLASGEMAYLGAVATDASGRGVVNWYTDFKRHDMGPA